MKNIFVLGLLILFLSSCKTEVKKEKSYDDNVEVRDPELAKESDREKIRTTAEAIADANGLQKWDKVKELKFTFNIDRDSSHYARSWSWKPKNDMVTLTSAQDTITYNRTQLDSTSIKADQGFINDKYWLLAPYNLVWDAASFTSKHEVKAIAPISNTEMQKLTIVYKDKGGYTPGDAYDFYFKGDFIIKEWVFRQGNTAEPSLITSWEDYQNFNGIKIAKTHNRKDGNWKLYFTDVAVIME
ncbi:hypothetical protein [Aquimarina algiphila]|uniref:hypothetical protein n=1 Tax=Aquimarina algiphila TaxID=2047982 RepID=UPI00232AE684|nr:hypothetical protein [Aquimarina algiphila]